MKFLKFFNSTNCEKKSNKLFIYKIFFKIICIISVCLFFSCQNKDSTNLITEKSIKAKLPKEYSWYYRDSINRPYEGYIVKGDSIKLYFNFHSQIVINIFDALDDYEEKTIVLNNNFFYKTFSKQTDKGISFYGILYDKANKNSKRTNCLIFIRTPENVVLNKKDYNTLNNLFINFKL